MDLEFDPQSKLLTRIGCYAAALPQHCPALFGIDTQSTEADVLALLGRADSETLSASKTLRYDALGLEVTLTKRRVYMLEKTAATGSSDLWFVKHRIF
ncbi:hypothetical protein ACVOMV_06935 [Mesorhizobium atlanticum]